MPAPKLPFVTVAPVLSVMIEVTETSAPVLSFSVVGRSAVASVAPDALVVASRLPVGATNVAVVLGSDTISVCVTSS